MSSGLVKCWVHGGQPIPAELSHEHHKQPRSAQGSDHPGNLVRVCPTCHNAIDRGAMAVSKGRSGQAKNMIEQYLPNDLDAQSRLAHLINIQAAAWKIGQRRDVRPVTFELGDDVYSQLKMLAKLHRHPTTGRAMGVGRYMRLVMEQHVSEQARMGRCVQVSPVKGDDEITVLGEYE